MWADYYTITFATGSGDGTSASTSTACSTIVSAGSSYLSGNLATATKVYYSGSNGLKLGTSSASGTIKMNLASSITPTSIVVNAKLYNSDKAATLKVNGSATQSITSDFSNLTFNITSQISYLQLESSKYCWISSITVNYAPAVFAPTFLPEAGTVAYGTTVELSQKDNKPIYYTTNGDAPTSSSTLYTTAITIDQDMTIKAIAVDGSNVSAVASATYTVQRPDAPTISDEGEVESGTEVTVTAPTGCTLYYTTNGEDPITLGTSAGSNSKTFTITEAQTIKAVSKDIHGYYSDVASVTYTIAVYNDPTFSVADMTMIVGEQKTPVVTTNSAGDVTFVSDNTSIVTIVDGKINAVAKGTVSITANLAKDVTNHYKAASITFDVTVNLAPVWESTSKGIDVLTYSSFFNSSEGTNSAAYTDFENKKGTSSAVYKGQAAKLKDSEHIQIRSKNSNSGIVTTTSGGKVREIEVTWHSNTNTGNKIDIYGKKSAYESASDLYDSSKSGTKIGSITCGTNTSLSISGEYLFIGIRSNDGACFLSNITIYWEGDAVSLTDASNYTPTAKDYAKVTLNRSFQEGWNGVVLPFDLTASVKTALGASDVKTLGSATEEGGAVTLNFTDATLPVAAGTPVLVKCGADLASGDVVINGAEIKTTTPTTVAKTVAGNTFTLTGTYSETDLEDAEAYFVAGTKFYHKAAGVELIANPFRSYIVQTAAANTARMAVNFNLEDNETAGVESSQFTVHNSQLVYDLQGRRVSSQFFDEQSGRAERTVHNSQLKKGLYIVNGKKVIKN